MTTRAKFEVEGGEAKKKKLSREGPPPWKIGLAVGLFAVAGFLIYWNTRPAAPSTVTPEQAQELNRIQQGMESDTATKKVMQLPPEPENTVDQPGSRARKVPGT